MLADALEHLVRGVVDHPDDVVVKDKQLRRGSILEVRVHPDDLGKVIGRNGRTATAFRTVVSALAGRGGARIDFVDVEVQLRHAVGERMRARCMPAMAHAAFVDRAGEARVHAAASSGSACAAGAASDDDAQRTPSARATCTPLRMPSSWKPHPQ